MVNVFDIGYLKTALLTTADQGTIDTSTITPTPTNTPTSTPIPLTRSFTKQEFTSSTCVGYGLNCTLKYWLYLPNGYTKDKKWPLVIFLHGAGERGSDLDKMIKNDTLPRLLYEGADFDAIIVTPQSYATGVYHGKKTHIRYIKEDLVPYLTEKYNIDTDRISVTGHSVGATATMESGSKFPGFYSCLVPLSLCVKTDWPNLNKENVWAFQGEEDSCSYKNATHLVGRMQNMGAQAKFTLIPNKAHVITKEVYLENKAIEWMIKQVRGQPVQN